MEAKEQVQTRHGSKLGNKLENLSWIPGEKHPNASESMLLKISRIFLFSKRRSPLQGRIPADKEPYHETVFWMEFKDDWFGHDILVLMNWVYEDRCSIKRCQKRLCHKSSSCI